MFFDLISRSRQTQSGDPLIVKLPYWDLSQSDNPVGRTQVDATLVSGEKTLIIVGAGQSNICNSEDTLYFPGSARVHNLSIYDGGCYQALPPMLGCSAGVAATGRRFYGSCWLMRLGDKLINAYTCARTIFVPVGVDASAIQNWIPGMLIPTADVSERITVAKARLDAAGLTADAFLWVQGESNQGNSQAIYQSFLTTFFGYVQQVFPGVPIFVGVATRLGGVNDANVEAAQQAIVNPAAGIYSGAYMDDLTLASGYRQIDDTHLSGAGADVVAERWMGSLGAYGGNFAYTTRAVTFNGSTTYLVRGANPTGLVNGKQGTISCWIKMEGGDGVEQRVIANAGPYFLLARTPGNKFVVSGQNAAAASILALTSTASYTAGGGWKHLLASWDLSAGKGFLYVNDASDLAGGSTLTNDTVNYATGDFGVGAVPDGTIKLNADVADLWFDTRYIDLSVTANRRKFIDANGKPVYLGSSGQGPTGFTPLVFLRGGASVFQTNLASGGNFTVTGALTDAPTTPA